MDRPGHFVVITMDGPLSILHMGNIHVVFFSLLAYVSFACPKVVLFFEKPRY